jgi:hypothetical protein
MRWLIAIYGPVVALIWIGAGVVNALLVLAAIVFLVLVLRVDIMSEWIQGWPEWLTSRRRTTFRSTSSQ